MYYNNFLYSIHGGTNTDADNQALLTNMKVLIGKNRIRNEQIDPLIRMTINQGADMEQAKFVKLIRYNDCSNNLLENYQRNPNDLNDAPTTVSPMTMHLVVYDNPTQPLNDCSIIKESTLVNIPLKNWKIRKRFFEYRQNPWSDEHELKIEIHYLKHILKVETFDENNYKRNLVKKINFSCPPPPPDDETAHQFIRNSQTITRFMTFKPLTFNFDVLKYFKFLQVLNLQNVSIDIETPLLNKTRVKEIYLKNVAIDLQEMLKVPKPNNSLEKMVIENNADPYGDIFVWDIFDTLLNCKKLQVLKIKNFKLDGDLYPNTFLKIPKLRVLDVSNNPKLQGRIHRNRRLSVEYSNTNIVVRSIEKRSQSTNSQYSSSEVKNTRYSYVG